MSASRVRAVVFSISMVVGALIGLGAFAVGGVTAGVGLLERHGATYDYVIGFRHPGGDCGNESLVLDLHDGSPLECEPAGVSGYMGRADGLPGFTGAQNTSVFRLAERLGADGLSTADQHRIQRQVDAIVLTIPAGRRPHQEFFWGARKAWTGAGLTALGVLLLVASIRLVIRSQRPSHR